MGRVLVLVSGGLDSAVALWWAAREGHDIVSLTFQYSGRPRGEVRAGREMVARAGVREAIEVPLPFVEEAADADHRLGTQRFRDAPPGYIPFRNALFYSAACYHAQIHGCEAVIGGHNAEDAARYPDASPAFFARLQDVLDLGAYSAPAIPRPRLVMPLLAFGRDEVHELGERLGVPMRETWSCYEDVEVPCEACPACLRRGELPSLARA